MIRRPLLPLALAGAVFTVAPAAAAQSQPGGPLPVQLHALGQQPALNLSAYGEVRVAPDLAVITFGVVTEAPSAQQAMADNAQRMNEVMAALRRAGIAERDIQTSGLNLQAMYDYIEDSPPRLRGYQTTNRVTVRVHDLQRVGATADAVVAAGVNQIDGIGFQLNDPKAAEDEARRRAVAALGDKARLYASALGVQLSGIRSLTEGSSYSAPPPMPMYVARETVVTAQRSTPIAQGELTVRIDVTGVYDIVR